MKSLIRTIEMTTRDKVHNDVERLVGRQAMTTANNRVSTNVRTFDLRSIITDATIEAVHENM